MASTEFALPNGNEVEKPKIGRGCCRPQKHELVTPNGLWIPLTRFEIRALKNRCPIMLSAPWGHLAQAWSRVFQ
jgi:hypothetical protein